MRKIKNHLNQIIQKKQGFTLVELVVAMTLSAVLITCAALAISISFKLYRRSATLSEGGILKSTLYYAIADELRYATLDQIDYSTPNAVTYTSAIHGGATTTMSVVDGYLVVDGKSVLSESAYTGYTLKEFIVSSGTEGCMNVTYSIENKVYGIEDDVEMVIRTLN